jgi:predicted MFS family arabinose efflux permease
MFKNLSAFFNNKNTFAVGFLFAIASVVGGSFYASIPAIKQKFGFTEGVLGLSLLLGPLGALIGVAISNWVFKKVHVGTFMYWGYTFVGLSVVAIIAAPTKLLFWCALFINGIFNFLNGVAANTTVPILEAQTNKHLMSTCHAMYSVGGGISAGLAFITFKLGFTTVHLALFLFVLIAAVQYLNKKYLLQFTEPIHNNDGGFALPNKSVLGIAFICMVLFMCEGCVADWSALYLQDVIHAPKAYLMLGYAAFAVAMTIGRLNGDTIIPKLGNKKIVLYCATIALIGFSLVVLIPNLFFALLGYTLVGLGCSCIVPVLFSASATIPNVSKVAGFSMVTTGGLIGVLGGPSFIGFLSEWVGLNKAFLLLVLLLLLVIVTALNSKILRQ